LELTGSPISASVSSISSSQSKLGSKFENLQQDLAALVSKSASLSGLLGGITFSEEGLYYRLSLQAEILFDFDRYNLRGDALPVLELVAKFIMDANLSGVIVEGHTDSKGTDRYNMALSERRAATVADWFKRRGQLGSAQIKSAGRGESSPRVPNTKPDGSDDPDGRAKNRRVEFLFPKDVGTTG
jgi:outer membrane protein OmpA-like peptidoglycan-associated protein